MEAKSKEILTNAFASFKLQNDKLERLSALNKLTLKIACGEAVKVEFDTGKYEKVKHAFGPCEQYVEKTFSIMYGEQWWRIAYWSALKLSPANKELLIKDCITTSQLDWLVKQDAESVKKLMNAYRNKEKIWPNRKPRKSIDHGSTSKGDEDNRIKDTFILPEIWDEEVFVNRLAHYITRFKGSETLILKAIEDAIRLSGIKKQSLSV